MEPRTDLNTAVRKLAAHQSPESRAEFSVALKALAESGTWVYMPGKKEEAGFSFAVLTARGKNFAAFKIHSRVLPYCYPRKNENPLSNGKFLHKNLLLFHFFLSLFSFSQQKDPRRPKRTGLRGSFLTI